MRESYFRIGREVCSRKVAETQRALTPFHCLAIFCAYLLLISEVPSLSFYVEFRRDFLQVDEERHYAGFLQEACRQSRVLEMRSISATLGIFSVVPCAASVFLCETVLLRHRVSPRFTDPQRKRVLDQYSVRAAAEKDNGNSFEEDLDIEEERIVFYIIEVEKNHFLKLDLAAPRDLPKARHPGFHRIAVFDGVPETGRFLCPVKIGKRQRVGDRRGSCLP